MKPQPILRPLVLSLLTLPLLGLPSFAEDTPLGKQMEVVGDSYKSSKKETDPQKGAALARDAQAQLLKSFSETPKIVADMPDGPKKQAALAEYRRMISESLTLMCKLEEAFLANNLKAVAEIREDMTTLRNNAHDKFKPEE